MRGLARWCVTHRSIVIATWLAVVVATVFIGSSSGSNYANGSKLSGTQSATAQNLLKQASPAAAGDSEQIVFATPHGSVAAPAVRAQIQPMLAKVAHLPNVANATAPSRLTCPAPACVYGDVTFATLGRCATLASIG